MPVIIATDDLPTILSKYGLAKYTDLFLRHEVDLQTFATLTEQDLREIGVQTFGARKKLLLLANSKLTISQCAEWDLNKIEKTEEHASGVQNLFRLKS